MKTKRIFSIISVLILGVVILAACSTNEDSDATTNDQIPLVSPSSMPAPPMTANAVRDRSQEGAMELAESASEAEVSGDMASDDGIAGGAPPPAPQALSIVPTAQPSAAGQPAPQTAPPVTPDAMTFDDPGTNPFFDTEDDNLSTFAMDVDTASYTVARSYLTSTGQLPPADAIRPEEFVNYFDAGYDSPGGDDAFAIYLDAAPAPFGYENHYLMRVGIQGNYIAPEDRDPVFLTFVIDVSGSMDREDRLELVKDTLDVLLGELREDDRVAIVVYSDASRVVLEPTPASDLDTIQSAIRALRPEGSTNVEDGLRLAYDLAAENKRDDENTRVIVLSDGVANVGQTGPDAILERIAAGVDDGITLSTIGFGMGNFNDVLMERLANDGDGNYFYVDNMRQARRVFVHNLTGTLQVIGYDAKVQVEFNADVTDRYRLIGYENRAIADEDFRNDAVDAGEVGAGHSVTALYELALEDADAEGVVATVYIRYEDADTREVVEIERSITTDDLLASMDDAPATFKMHAAVAEFSELLRDSTWAEDGSYGAVMALLNDAQDDLTDTEDIKELIAMVELAVQYGDQ